MLTGRHGKIRASRQGAGQSGDAKQIATCPHKPVMVLVVEPGGVPVARGSRVPAAGVEAMKL